MRIEILNCMKHNLLPQEDIILNEDVWYSCDANEFLEELEYPHSYVYLNNYDSLRAIGIDVRGNDIYLLKGTKMTYLDDKSGGWPSFRLANDIVLTICDEIFEIIRGE